MESLRHVCRCSDNNIIIVAVVIFIINQKQDHAKQVQPHYAAQRWSTSRGILRFADVSQRNPVCGHNAGDFLIVNGFSNSRGRSVSSH